MRVVFVDSVPTSYICMYNIKIGSDTLQVRAYKIKRSQHIYETYGYIAMRSNHTRLYSKFQFALNK